MGSKKEIVLLEDLIFKTKAIIENQSVLRDNISDIRMVLRHILERLEEIETTSEVIKSSLRRKIDIEALEVLEKKILELERHFPIIS